MYNDEDKASINNSDDQNTDASVSEGAFTQPEDLSTSIPSVTASNEDSNIAVDTSNDDYIESDDEVNS